MSHGWAMAGRASWAEMSASEDRSPFNPMFGTNYSMLDPRMIYRPRFIPNSHFEDAPLEEQLADAWEQFRMVNSQLARPGRIHNQNDAYKDILVRKIIRLTDALKGQEVEASRRRGDFNPFKVR
jgi:hypothetical protein